MLPQDPDPAADAAPRTDLQPTGLIDGANLAPVPTTAVQPRRGWPFAASLVLVAVMAGGALFMSGYSIGRDQGLAPSSSLSEAEAWAPFWNVYKAITERYPLEPIERTTLIQGAIRGIVEAVGDPYSSYLSPDDFTGTLNDISGTFEGIGAEIGSVDAAGNTSDCATFGPDCFLVVIAPLDGSPAEKAGLRPGDVILTVDGSRLDGLNPDEARDRVRGKAGSEVKLHIQRFAAPVPVTPAPTGSAAPVVSPVPSGAPAPTATPKPRELIEEFDVTLIRAKIQRREVTSRVLADGTVGYASLSGFSGAGSKELKDAVKAHVDAGIKKIVLDLRGNPGGFIVDALAVASEFIPDGAIYWTQDAQGKQTATDARPGGVATDPPIHVVVLIDRGTASASEIVAGALQDRARATLIGETSFGKGTVQEWIGLGENDSLGGVKLTVNKWLTPDKRWIHKVGLTPDIVVTVPTDTPAGEDPVLDRALEALAVPAGANVSLLRAA
jgi:carboxyl-terminal processing protease